MAKPTAYPRWAEETRIDSVTGANNKVEPPEGFKLSGLLRGEFLARPFLNYQFNNISGWIEYFDNSVVTDVSAETDITRDNGYKQELNLTANTVLTESLQDGEEVEIKVVFNSFTVTWPASFNWGDAGEPTGFSEVIVKGRKYGTTVYATTEWSVT